MKAVFRADASSEMGAGHVVRCLTLADALLKKNVECHFICCKYAGDLRQDIVERGYIVHEISANKENNRFDWQTDAEKTAAIVNELQPDWLIADNYLLPAAWESYVKSSGVNLFVIDDIGRPHECDLLLDQNYANPRQDSYKQNSKCKTGMLLGPRFALLRPDFAFLRSKSLNRRQANNLTRLLVSFGGGDVDNETGKALAGIKNSLRTDWVVDVVIGAGNPNEYLIREACEHNANFRLHVQTSAMAELMLLADISIGAGGGTTWERCCMGLPALVTVLSDDQHEISKAVASAGAQKLMGMSSQLVSDDYQNALDSITDENLEAMSIAAAAICDGQGADRVAKTLCGVMQ